MLPASVGRFCRRVQSKGPSNAARRSGRSEAAGLAFIESKTPVEGGIAEDENSAHSAASLRAIPSRISRLPTLIRWRPGSTATGPSASAGNGACSRENMAWPMTVSASTATSEKTESPASRRSSTNCASADRPNASSSTARIAATSPGVSGRTIIRHTSSDLTEAAVSRKRGRKRSIISADDTRSTCAPMLMAATMTPS